MPLDVERARRYLAEFRLEPLFVEELGWDRYPSHLDVAVDGETYRLRGVAEKRGMAAFVVEDPDGPPDYATRRKIERQAAKSVHEHLIVYADGARTRQVWQWVRREPGRPTACRELHYQRGQSGEALIQRLDAVTFTLDEEVDLSIVDVTRRARAAFDVERVTKRFYDLFKAEHDAFLGFIQGLKNREDLEWYASVMLNRLMFVYFIQKKGFLDEDRDYLRNRLAGIQAEAGRDHFHSFYRHFLLRLFHEGLGQRRRSSELDALLGRVPYLNGGLFDVHELERNNPDIQIPDEAFEQLFDLFDAYQWHLDDRPLRADNEINPDVLGYIFEKYVNQKQMGAYYTKEDITDYITANTLIPRLLEKLAAHADEFAFTTVADLVAADPDRYIHDPLRHGSNNGLPDEIAAGVDDPSKRGQWNAAGGPSYALPTETWREVVARRQHHGQLRTTLARSEVGNVSELVGLNLNLQQLALDLIESCDSPTLLGSIYHNLEALTVLDPTCGSGAFLFAALNILEPLYEAALERMTSFLADGAAGDARADFIRITEGVGRHPSRAFFVLKKIVVNNLYGVDIMEEAVEICKLRLFLRLVSQVDWYEQLEPLPDIDFNVRAGNSLVGFASLSELRRELGSKLDLASSAQRIEERSVDVDRAFERFRTMQLAENLDDTDLAEAKDDLRTQLEGLRAELDAYLAAQYGRDASDEEAYASWLATHLPFHWLVEFHEIMSRDGFDVIIGNPPYIELGQLRGYRPIGYRTIVCGNVYALFVERTLALLATAGHVGMIVPMSLSCTQRMAELREVLSGATTGVVVAHFSGDANPSTLFEGVKGRLDVFLAKRRDQTDKQSPNWRSSSYRKWFADERPSLFPLLRYELERREYRYLGLIPKLGDATAAAVVAKLLPMAPLANWSGRSSRTLYVHRVITQFIKCFDFVPYFWNESEGVKKSEDYKPYTFASDDVASSALALLNSSTFWFYFTVFGDGFHCGKDFVLSFPAGLDRLTSEQRTELRLLSRELMVDMQEHAVRRRARSKRTGAVEYDEFWPRHSKPIIDKIDDVAAKLYAFSPDEADYVKNYLVKYRLGRGELTGDGAHSHVPA